MTATEVHRLVTDWPDNVTVLGETERPGDLYETGDVAVQPSRYEGIGLQLLETQAAGMPLVTTEAGPMNEYGPMVTIGAPSRRITVVRPTQCYDMDPAKLAGTLRKLAGTDIRRESHDARANVEAFWSWNARRDKILAALTQLCFPVADAVG